MEGDISYSPNNKKLSWPRKAKSGYTCLSDTIYTWRAQPQMKKTEYIDITRLTICLWFEFYFLYILFYGEIVLEFCLSLSLLFDNKMCWIQYYTLYVQTHTHKIWKKQYIDISCTGAGVECNKLLFAVCFNHIFFPQKQAVQKSSTYYFFQYSDHAIWFMKQYISLIPNDNLIKVPLQPPHNLIRVNKSTFTAASLPSSFRSSNFITWRHQYTNQNLHTLVLVSGEKTNGS